MVIPEDKISEILNVSDIVEIISDSVSLKKSGRNYFGLCPFHSEKTPSFSVSPQKQIFHCFGCSAGGNVISFLMKLHRLSFPEAARMLAKRYGIAIPLKEISPEEREKLELKEGLFRINSQIRDYYSHQLKYGDYSEKARLYLKNRSLSEDIIEELGLGFSPDRWDSVVSLFKKMRLSKKVAEMTGLVLERKSGSGYYDRFRNRIIFPIFDINMQIVGFGGRVLDDSLPKYLNSPETPVYSKGRVLYGLHVSKQFCRQIGSVYIVEGYFDFLSMYQAGIKNCVATLGTALTIEHVRLLKGYASRIYLVFDSDDAGVNAARRGIELFLKEGVDLKVIVLPKGQDPDSFIRSYGAEAFESEASKAMAVIDFLTETFIKKYGLSIEGKVSVLDEIKAYIASIDDSTARSLYVKEIAYRLGIDETAILDKLKDGFISPSKRSYGVEKRGYTGDRSREGSSGGRVVQLSEAEKEAEPRERQILSIMLQFPEIIDCVKVSTLLDSFYSVRMKKIGELILNASEVYRGADSNKNFVGLLMSSIQNEIERELVASLAMAEIAEVDNLEDKSVFLINRIINLRRRNDSTLTHEIRKIEQLEKKRAGKRQIIESGKDQDADLTLDLLRQRQIEIRKLRGYE